MCHKPERYRASSTMVIPREKNPTDDNSCGGQKQNPIIIKDLIIDDFE